MRSDRRAAALPGLFRALFFSSLVFGGLRLSAVPAAAADAPEVVPVRGTRIVMIRPEGFADAAAFTGFVHTRTPASIMVSEVRAPASRLFAAMTDENLARQGMTPLSREPVRIQNREGVLVRVRHRKGTDYEKWLLVFGDDESGFMINASWPAASGGGDPAGEMRRAVMSAIVADSATHGNPFADLTFRLEPPPGLSFAERRGKTVYFTPSGRMPSPGPQGTPADPDEPLFMIGTSFSTFDVTRPGNFAETRLGLTEGIRDVKIEMSRPYTLDGLAAHEVVASAHEVVASARDRATGREVAFYQILVFEDARVFHFVLGRTGAETRHTRLGEYLKSAHTFARINPPAPPEAPPEGAAPETVSSEDGSDTPGAD